ncbi:hypothetical protein H310_11275 [Aphanomyces invadans]|uniref:TLDc domain-containing protein n=1 Tax=Aphanomyces invadans TaxID=157072 RepID=A0A024TQ15_9STRA|nr:hypothetical protein H310_11275 [Aphanomyces invadans]ETV95397.1 hypothetical protein H310_11275 [Aphanomyces invadans]|eukprot:XP_008876098.1 hypothetical protein H310_11275 [Aphanomyces invadans]
MGNSHSGQLSARELEELKGPFSDAEFDALQALVAESDANKGAFLERFSLGPLRGGSSDHVLNDFGDVLYKSFARTDGDTCATNNHLTIVHVAKAAADCIRSSSTTVLRALVSILNPSLELSPPELHQLFMVCMLMADDSNSSSPAGTPKDVREFIPMATSMVDAFQLHSSHITPSTLAAWIPTHAPLLHTVFSSWMSRKCLGVHSKVSYVAPRLSHPSDILSRGEALALSMQSVQLQNNWDRLYTSTEDGLSFNRLTYHLLGYTGPTLLVMTDADGATFGAYADTPWKESTKFFGGPGCFLFRTTPSFLLCPATTGAASNYMYYNTKGVVLPRGLGFGGTTSKCRLFLDDELDDCTSALKCGSYEPGAVAMKGSFRIQMLEVWGCGGDECKLAQHHYRADTAELINRARKVDKAQFAGNAFDREMFLSKTFSSGADGIRLADDEH